MSDESGQDMVVVPSDPNELHQFSLMMYESTLNAWPVLTDSERLVASATFRDPQEVDREKLAQLYGVLQQAGSEAERGLRQLDGVATVVSEDARQRTVKINRDPVMREIRQASVDETVKNLHKDEDISRALISRPYVLDNGVMVRLPNELVDSYKRVLGEATERAKENVQAVSEKDEVQTILKGEGLDPTKRRLTPTESRALASVARSMQQSADAIKGAMGIDFSDANELARELGRSNSR